jgi:hypothetical protein
MFTTVQYETSVYTQSSSVRLFEKNYQTALAESNVLLAKVRNLETSYQRAGEDAAAAKKADMAIPNWYTKYHETVMASLHMHDFEKEDYHRDVKREYEFEVFKASNLVCETQRVLADTGHKKHWVILDYMAAVDKASDCLDMVTKETKEEAVKYAASEKAAAKINAFPFIQYYSYQFFTGLKIF